MAPRPSDTRRRILECTIRLLGTQGPQAFSAAALAQELGVSKATVFHHFPTLDSIPQEAFELLFEDFVQWQLPQGMTLKQLLDRLGKMTFQMLEQRGDFLRAYYVFFGRAMFDDRLRERLANYLAEVNESIAAQFVQVGLKKKDARRVANMALLMLDGISLHLLASHSGGELRRSWTAFSSMVFKEISSEQETS